MLANLEKLQKHILGFFQAKGFLFTPNIKALPNVKLDINDVVLFANQVEPRIWEVLPAAIIYFPNTFQHQENLPEEIKKIIMSIKKNERITGTYKGIEIESMFRWAHKKIKDRRVSTLDKRKQMKSFRIDPKMVNKLKKLADERQISLTSMLEKIIHDY